MRRGVPEGGDEGSSLKVTPLLSDRLRVAPPGVRTRLRGGSEAEGPPAQRGEDAGALGGVSIICYPSCDFLCFMFLFHFIASKSFL